MTGNENKRLQFFGIGILTFVVFVTAAIILSPATFVNAENNVTIKSDLDPQRGGIGNDACLTCHNKPDQSLKLPNGDALSATIDKESYIASVHGGQEVLCTDCHTNITGYPHPELTAKDRVVYSAQYDQTCIDCHKKETTEYHDGVHSKMIAAGDVNAPTCSDCHNPHTQGKITDVDKKLLSSERVNIPQKCANCHSTIFEEYAKSVHGEGILLENNTDVATCTDCHGVHAIKDPTTANYRLHSAEMCSNCHTNKAIMDKYGLSTNVLNSYVADFHGTTVKLFEETTPNELTSKPVCYDCHGVHNIPKVDDPKKGLQVRQNLAITCKKCHPDATENFPDSWLSHYDPSPSRWPLVYYVNLFYQILIPTVIGGMIIFVITDFIRRQIDLNKKRNKVKEEASSKEGSK